MKRFNELSVLLETSSGITPTVDTVNRFVDVISRMGYNKLYLGMADAYKIKEQPRFGYKRGGYTVEDLRAIDAHAKKCGLEVVAQIQILGHLHYLRKFPEFEDLFDTNDTLLVGDEKVYSLIDQMVKTIYDGLSSKEIHIGMDETYGLGTGNYLKNNEPTDKMELYLRHLDRVCEILNKYGYKSVKMWGDMLRGKSSISRADIAKRLPENVSVIVWDYEISDEEQLGKIVSDGRELTSKIGSAGAVWKYLSFGPNNAYSTNCILAQMKAYAQLGVDSYMITLWSDNIAPCSNFAALPTLYAAAEFAAGNIDDIKDLNKERFLEVAGIPYDAMYALEYLDNPFKEKTTSRSCSSLWFFYTDLLLGNFDTLAPNGVEKAYSQLARYYRKYASNMLYGHIFKMSASRMKVLAIRAHLPQRIRDAYLNKDKQTATEIVSDLRKLKVAIKGFLKDFCEYYLHDNFAFGVEVYHERIGAQIIRCDYAIERLNAFVKNDEIIDELENGVLPLGYNPMPDISHGLMYDLKMLVSYCL